MPCSLAWRTLTFLSTKPSARSARMATSFLVPTPLGPPSPLVSSPASMITSSALTPLPSIWMLQRMHGPASGMPWRSMFGGEVLVVGAVPLVGVRERLALVARAVAVGAVLLARGVVGGLRARGGLQVEPGHDHDAVVVARLRHRRLDLVERAALEQLLVDR